MPQSEFWILGGGTERKPLEALADRLGIAARVRFIGTVLPQDVYTWLRRADAGVLATRQDVFLDYSFSNKLSEYVIMGKPVIASRLRTINHYFGDGALAYFAPGDPQSLADRMVTIYRDDELRARLVQQAPLELHPIVGKS
jgi:glycosyltransferase involved in cell wall biosynthesis